MALLLGGSNDVSFVEANVGSTDTISVTLQKWGDETIKKLRQSIRDSTSNNTSRNLEQKTVVLPVQFGVDKWVMSFQSADYWKFINDGVQGVGGKRKGEGSPFVNRAPGSQFSFKQSNKPSAKHFDLWANTKGLNKYAIRESVFRQGIKATHYFDKVITDQWVNILVKRIAKSGAKEVTLILAKQFR